MDGKGYHDSVNDPALDREIESLLAADPSPEFLARVRTRVAQEPGVGSWRTSWLVGAAGVVAVVIVAISVWPSSEPVPAHEEPAPIPSVASGVEQVPSQSSPAPEPVRRPAGPRTVAVVAARERGIEIDLPEVVIGDNEMRAYTALVASIRQRRFDVAVPAASNPDTPVEIKELPPVGPLEIEPIVRVAALQAEGERP